MRMRWFMKQAGNGHIVVLRASQAGEIGEEFFNEVGGIKSVETFVFKDREASTDPKILAALKRATASSWPAATSRATCASGAAPRRRGTGRARASGQAARRHQRRPGHAGRIPLWRDGRRQPGQPGALADPLGDGNTIETDFLHIAQLKGVITDTHFSERAGWAG
jgi:beta-aspartyl-peptidase (threonine type)